MPPCSRPWLVVDLADLDVTAPQSEAGVAFPVVVEAVDAVELDGAERVDEQSEHAAAADGGELQRVADERDPPALHVGEVGQFGELGGGHHPGLVDDDGRPDRQVVAPFGWPVEPVLDEELVERVGLHAGLGGEHFGCGRRGGDAEHRSTVGAELGDGGCKRGGLAGAGRADDEHEVVAPGDCAAA